jgi:hypothetical protein
MKLPPVVNFINFKRANFMYESVDKNVAKHASLNAKSGTVTVILS